jgi:hypothetical protein
MYDVLQTHKNPAAAGRLAEAPSHISHARGSTHQTRHIEAVLGHAGAVNVKSIKLREDVDSVLRTKYVVMTSEMEQLHSSQLEVVASRPHLRVSKH